MLFLLKAAFPFIAPYIYFGQYPFLPLVCDIFVNFAQFFEKKRQNVYAYTQKSLNLPLVEL